MVRTQKWLKCLSRADSASEAARKSLRLRLCDVAVCAPLAAQKHQENVEHVHQLRVSVRRADAAIQLYVELAPSKRLRSARKRLRRIRRAAGDARDLDVLIGRISDLEAFADRSAKAELLKQIGRERVAAQKPLARVIRNEKRNGFKRAMIKLTKKIRWRGEGSEPDFYAWARTRLQPIIDDFFAAACGDLSRVENLHQMRICGKQLRYAMELLSVNFDESFRTELYPIVEEIQIELGKINDHASAIAFFQDRAESKKYKRCRSLLKDLLETEQSSLQQDIARFRDAWSTNLARSVQSLFETAMKAEPKESRSNAAPKMAVGASSVSAAG